MLRHQIQRNRLEIEWHGLICLDWKRLPKSFYAGLDSGLSFEGTIDDRPFLYSAIPILPAKSDMHG